MTAMVDSQIDVVAVRLTLVIPVNSGNPKNELTDPLGQELEGEGASLLDSVEYIAAAMRIIYKEILSQVITDPFQ